MKPLQTPFFRIKEQSLQYDISLLKQSLADNWGNYIAAYSVKTNSLPWLLNYLKEQEFYAEVVSKMEYDLAVRLGFPRKHIIYNGPIKDKKTFETVLLAGGYVNLDSNYELDWMEELSRLYPNRHFKVGLRVNCDLSLLCHEEIPASQEGGRFGYCYENGVLKAALERLSALPNVWAAGLHMHTSTQSRSIQVFGALAKMAVTIAKEYALCLDYVDMGGGYFGGRDDKPDYRDYFKEICKELSAYFNPQKTILIAEPGVSLISRATTFETSVIDVKDIRNRKFVVTDGSRTNLNPLVTRHVYPHHIHYISDTSVRKTESSQWICGATCMEYDKLFEIIDDIALVPGDQIIYDTAGGYTICLNPLFINYLPAVYVEHEDGTLFTARKAWDNEEYLQKNYVEKSKRRNS
ncbi:type III PLP-dependent enzyme domain-containing protein [Parablautia muri]|uniref:Pyridoxal-dependent decarboxylase n=1 Tax=Parablautia muri TaxID=2320879 RepID=A0A9X5BC52_9FIRM|nr:pyridoxal-dependent decarboxylase [Parablautia muri]NBJ91264.1 pyridoxal-dependent decarboxylase [Parablautia muri]